MALIVLLVPLSIFLLFLLQKHCHTKSVLEKRRPRLHPPGPPGLPFVGNLLQLDSTSALHSQLARLSTEYGPLMSLRLGSVPALVVSSAKMAREVMKTQDLNFSDRPTLVGQQKLSYGGFDLAFAPYGDYWREMKKHCTVHFFSSKRVQSFRSIREDEVGHMIKKVAALATASKAANLRELMMCLSSAIVCRTAFGKAYEEDEHGSGKSRFHDLLNESQAMMACFFVSDYLPWMGWVDHLTGLRRRLHNNFREWDSFYQEIIDDHLKSLPQRSDSSGEDDITNMLLRLWKEQLFSNGFTITLDQIKGVLMNIIVAGTDTSAATVVWAMAELMKNQEELKRATEEVRKLKVARVGFINEDEVQKLCYLKAVVKEALRLHPVAPLLIPHQAIQKCEIEGYEIELRTITYINAWAIGRDPKSWENPEVFSPERFMKNDAANKDFKGSDFEFIPFGAGRRICPGLHLGLATVELALANLLLSFNWELPPGAQWEDIYNSDVFPGITMHKKIPLCLTPRYIFPNKKN